MLRRIYGSRIDDHNYGTTLASVAFAGTIVGMLVFGYLSDKIGTSISTSTSPSLVLTFFQDASSEWLVAATLDHDDDLD